MKSTIEIETANVDGAEVIDDAARRLAEQLDDGTGTVVMVIDEEGAVVAGWHCDREGSAA